MLQVISTTLQPAGSTNADGNLVVNIAPGTAIPTGYLRLIAYTINSINRGSDPVDLVIADYGLSHGVVFG